MRNLKKFLALVLAMMMTLSLMVTVNASSFKDDDQINSKYAEAVNVLTGLKVIKGYKNGDTVTFDPKANITRAEVAAIVYRIFTGDVGDKNIHLYDGFSEFSDVAGDKWYTPYVNFCANNGLVNGVGGNRFAPSANVTGYEALVMILRAVGYNNPSEFSSSDWKFKASGYGRRLGITTNIPDGSLGASATREMVAEIMFKGLLAPTVTYSPLTQYTENLLVDASAVNEAADAVVYANDVKSTLMYEIFQIVGKRTVLVNDNYGRPVVEWVKDAKNDTVENGGMYIPNAQTKPGVGISKDTPKNGVFGNINVEHDAVYIPASTPGATYADINDAFDWYVRNADCIDKTALSITMAPVKTYYDKVSECNLSKDVNGDESINCNTELTEWLNGAKVETRTDYVMDALHTATGDTNPTVGAPGRTTEVYQIGTTSRGSGIFVFVYIDTLLGVVDTVTPRTFDTAGHVMTPASLQIKVNEQVPAVMYYDYESDFSEWKYGDLILLTTYGGHNWNDKNTAKTGPSLNATDTAKFAFADIAKLQTSVPVSPADFTWYDKTFTDSGDVADVLDAEWAVDILDEKPTTETFTVNATVGAMDLKTGLISTDNKTYMGNVVYLANESANHGFYDGLGATQIDDATSVSASATDYGVPMVNARIGQTVTAVRDTRGYVVGLTMATVTSDVGVILGMDSVRIATGKYAVEAEMLMMDGSKKTVRFLHNDQPDDYSAAVYDFYSTSGKADDAITTPDDENCNFQANMLARITPYIKEGATYYKVSATNDGEDTAFTTAGVTDRALGDTTSVKTGVANTLADGTKNADFVYPATPKSVNTVEDLADNKNYINDNTKFIIAEYDYRYNQGEANEGGYTDLVYKTYTGFKNIPTITGAANEILWQKIGNNVFIYPQTDANTIAVANRRFTLRDKATYAVDETYLVLGTIATYADHATYKVLKDGVEATLEVSNNNINTVNKDVETAMRLGQLIFVDSKNSAGYATSVKILDDATYTYTLPESIRTIAVAKDLKFAKDGVLYNNTDATFVGTAATKWLTVADNCKVVIVNLLNGTYVDGSLDSVMQYENYIADDANGTKDKDDAPNGHSFVYELDQYGYVSTLYIID